MYLLFSVRALIFCARSQFGSCMLGFVLRLLVLRLSAHVQPSLAITVELWTGTLTVKNIVATDSLLRLLAQPLVRVHSVSVGQVKLHVPWRRLTSQSVRLEVDSVNVGVVPIRLSSTTERKAAPTLADAKLAARPSAQSEFVLQRRAALRSCRFACEQVVCCSVVRRWTDSDHPGQCARAAEQSHAVGQRRRVCQARGHKHVRSLVWSAKSQLSCSRAERARRSRGR
mgnify:CR=1 FL=1